MAQIFALLNDGNIKFLKFKNDNTRAEIEKLLIHQYNEFSQNKEEMKFNGIYRPEEDELLFIETREFDYIFTKIKDVSTVFELKENEIIKLKSIFYKLDDDTIIMNSITASNILRPTKLSFLYGKDSLLSENNSHIFNIPSYSTLILKKDKIIFHSYFNACKIFDLKKFYRNATDKDVKEFINSAIFKFPDNLDKNKLAFSIPELKKIALIQDSKILGSETFDKIKNLINELNKDNNIIIENKNIIFPTEKKDIKFLLNLLSDKFAETKLSRKNILTNSCIEV